jgi:hypothetical protein
MNMSKNNLTSVICILLIMCIGDATILALAYLGQSWLTPFVALAAICCMAKIGCK